MQAQREAMDEQALLVNVRLVGEAPPWAQKPPKPKTSREDHERIIAQRRGLSFGGVPAVA